MCEFQHQVVNEQKTKCDTAEVIGNTFICNNPVISYGSVSGGVPTDIGEDYITWCQEMGFSGHIGNVETRMERISSPYGWVFGCSHADSSSWHWCDGYDGYWLNQSLDYQGKTIENFALLSSIASLNKVP